MKPHSGTIVSALRSGVAKHGKDPSGFLDPAFQKQMTVLHNSARGDMHEQMAQIAAIATFDTVEIERSKCFDTPFGKRFVDLYLPERNIAIEVKSGRICRSRLIRSQIRKDHWLVQHCPDIERVIWMLFEGASLPVLNSCNANGLEVMDGLTPL